MIARDFGYFVVLAIAWTFADLAKPNKVLGPPPWRGLLTPGRAAPHVAAHERGVFVVGASGDRGVRTQPFIGGFERWGGEIAQAASAASRIINLTRGSAAESALPLRLVGHGRAVCRRYPHRRQMVGQV